MTVEHSAEQKDKTVGANIRLSLTRAVTRKQGDDYAKTIATIESPLPLGMDVLGGTPTNERDPGSIPLGEPGTQTI